jgi:hypothetical protein
MRNRPIAGRYLQDMHVNKVKQLLTITDPPRGRFRFALSKTGIGRRETYGFTGSLKVSKKSSILLVCSLIASSGLGSLLASPLLGPPNEVWPPRL